VYPDGALSEEDRSLLIGQSPSIQALRKRIETVARTQPSVTVLIWGPSGSGKELVAQEIHRLNPLTSKGKFIPVDLSYVPRELAGSRLFGHERGAFTGAHDRRRGAFEEGAGGTVFLDEVSSISLEFQGMFLRVLQEREFSPLGSVRTIKTNARIIAASNENLWEKVQKGLFRQDLYFRLKVLQINVPPLADRKEDIPLLVRHFIKKHAAAVGCPPDLDVEEGVYEELASRQWPGNVRQLENVVIQSLASAEAGKKLRVRNLAPEGIESIPSRDGITASLLDLPYPEAHKEMQRIFREMYWARKLQQTGGNVSQAARLGGVLPASLHRMIRSSHIQARRMEND